MTVLRLRERHQVALDELHVLMQRFPRVISDMNALDDKPMCTDHIWHEISKQMDLYSGKPCFKHLAEFAKFLLLILHSNLYCENTYSAIRKICSHVLRNLGEDATQRHASTSVYMETTPIRKNLLDILIPKINIFEKKKLACYEWEPTKCILAQAKPATYKNLQARKKQQQQAAANEDPED